ncbi:MAG: helix-turn-helix transcriptional regulator [Filifactoraceae bacterium]
MNNIIKKVINEKGLKATFVIKKIGISTSTFYDIVNGNSTPSLVNARKISSVLGVSLSELFPENCNENIKEVV